MASSAVVQPRSLVPPVRLPRILRERMEDVILPLLRRLEHGQPRGPHVAPGPPIPAGWRWWILGDARDPLQELLEAANRYGDVVRTAIGTRGLHMPVHLLRHPDHIAHVLVSHRENYSKSLTYRILEGVMGQGLLTTEGELWRTHRRMLNPLFGRGPMARYFEAMRAAAEDLAQRWRRPGGPVDVAADMARYTLDVVGRCLFGADLGRVADEVGRSLAFLLRSFDRRMSSGLGIASLAFVDLPFPASNRQILEAIGTLERVIDDLIARRRRSPEAGEDMLGLLLAAQDEETGVRLTDRQVRDHIMTFLLAGHETTANLLAWTSFLLARHPGTARRLRAELQRVVGSGPLTLDHLPALGYTRAVIQEALRLYPPAWVIERDVLAPDTIAGFRIPAGSIVALSPWVTHRHPALWPHPEGFDPERFLPHGHRGDEPPAEGDPAAPAPAAPRPRFAYFPFGGGPRQCIGADFAIQEAVVALAVLVPRFEMELVPGCPVVPQATVTLRPRRGVLVWVRPR